MQTTQVPTFNPKTDGWGAPEQPERIILIGPPGTGKTRSVLEAWALPALRSVDAHRVLVCSFSRAAAEELRERVSLPFAADELRRTFSTIHSACKRAATLELGQYIVYGDRKRALVETGVPEEDEADIDRLSDAMAAHGQEQRAEAIRVWERARHNNPNRALDGESPYTLMREEQPSASPGFPFEALVGEAVAYEAEKRSLGQRDFTDMLLDGGLRCEPPERDLLIVDEAQDCSPLQAAVVARWASRARVVAYVGDPDQCVFAHACADPDWLYRLMREGVAARRLSKSWRVPKRAHAIARDLILKNPDRIDAPYEPSDENGFVMDIDRARAVAYVEDHAAYGNKAFVLAYSARILGDYAGALSAEGVPFRNERGKCPWQEHAKRQLVTAILKTHRGLDLTSEEAVRLIDSLPARTAKEKQEWFLGRNKTEVKAEAKAREGSIAVATLGINHRRLAFEGQSLARDAETSIRQTKEDANEYRPVLRLLDWFDRMAYRRVEAGVTYSALEVLTAFNAPPVVTLTTFHGSKGREAEVVVVDLECPRPVARDVAQGRSAQARRALYVGLTRTKDILVLARPVADCEDIGWLLGMDAEVGGETARANLPL